MESRFCSAPLTSPKGGLNSEQHIAASTGLASLAWPRLDQVPVVRPYVIVSIVKRIRHDERADIGRRSFASRRKAADSDFCLDSVGGRVPPLNRRHVVDSTIARR